MALTDTTRKALIWLAIALVLALSISLMQYTIEHENEIRGFIAGIGIAGPILSVGLFALLGASPVPSEPVTIMSGVLFGPMLATAIAGTGNTLAALVEYGIGAGISSTVDFEEKRRKLPLGLGKLPVNSVWFLLGGRMIPGVAPKLISVAGGVYRVPMWRFIWTTAVPAFLGAALFAYGGASLLRLF